MGILISGLGGTAIVFECFWSYIGNAIWSGVVFFIVTGAIGSASTSGQNKLTAYAFLSGLSGACAAQLLGLSIFAAIQELELICQPGINYAIICTYIIESRIGVDATIAALSFITLIASLTASCLSCSVPPPITTTIVVQGRTSVAPLPTAPAYPGVSTVQYDGAYNTAYAHGSSVSIQKGGNPQYSHPGPQY
ncbi:uncharacterized protein [Diadema antillarum]|uniref:uncharacterized protein n=1 Tax=Diadema antillarum TaxID=105358 RepID=UPI003A8B64DD